MIKALKSDLFCGEKTKAANGITHGIYIGDAQIGWIAKRKTRFEGRIYSIYDINGMITHPGVPGWATEEEVIRQAHAYVSRMEHEDPDYVRNKDSIEQIIENMLQSFRPIPQIPSRRGR